MREEDAMTTSSFVGIALRVAQGMGLHRDGSHFGLDRVKAEVRRHIWWYIIHTDVMTSIWCGLPAIWVDDGCHDTRMISDYVQIYQHDASTAAKNSEIQVSLTLMNSDDFSSRMVFDGHKLGVKILTRNRRMYD